LERNKETRTQMNSFLL